MLGVLGSDGVSRLGLGLEGLKSRLETHFCKSQSRS